MHFVDALILGTVQGLTEFLPISSSAHIRIVGELLGMGGDPGARFTAIIQLGTEAAVLIYFGRDIVRIISRWALSLVGRVSRSDPDARMGWLVLLGSIPIVVLGLLFHTTIETTLRSLWVVAVSLIVFGVALAFADRFGRTTRRLEQLSVRDGILYGLAQSLALIPGVSRSGGTIGAGRALGYERAAAARYSFLLAIPAVFGSGLYQTYRAVTDRCATDGAAPAQPGCTPEIFSSAETVAATVVAFVVGLVVIAFFMRYIKSHTFAPFIVYRCALGGLLIVLLSTGAMQP